MTDLDPQDPGFGRPRRGVSRRRFLQGAAGGAAFLVGGPMLQRVPSAQAAATNPIVVENALPGSGAFQLGAGKFNGNFAGFVDKTSVLAGEELRVRLNDFSKPYQGPNGPTATLEIYRLGYYGGAGGRLVRTVGGAPLRYQDNYPALDGFGYSSFTDAWPQSSPVPTDGLESGMYLIKVLPDDGSGRENHIPFVVRADDRPRDVLVVMPTNSWQAYNNFSFKSLYNSQDLGDPASPTIAGADASGKSRAVKVSFDRPYSNVIGDWNWVLRTEFPLIYWLERQGYDLTYTDDVALDAAGVDQLTAPMTKSIAIAGHSEYWTKGMFDNIAAARDAGTHIASFSANTSYWQVRYEDDRRTMVCFKTVAGIDSDAADQGRDGVNDFGPLLADGSTGGSQDRGGPYDPLTAGSAYATTTFRDAGAPAGSANAPDAVAPREFEGSGRIGPDRPENGLWGVMFVGGDGKGFYPLQVPPGAGDGGEFGAHPAWRHTTLAARGGGPIGANLVGWEWDGIPQGSLSQPYGRYVSRQPSGVKRLTHTDVNAANAQLPAADRDALIFLLDEGRHYSYSGTNTPATPAAGQGSFVNAVTYRAASGALVFAAGTMQWSWGLGPHFETMGSAVTYEDPRVDDSEPNIQQATYNILADCGVKPATPDGVILDPEPGTPPPAGGGATQPPPVTGPPKVVPKPGPPPKLVVRGGRKVIRKDGEVRLRVRCRKKDRGGCFGTVTLVALLPRPDRNGVSRKPRRIKLRSRRVELVPGQSEVLSFKLSKRHRRMVRRRKRLKVAVETRVSDLAGNGGFRRTFLRLYAKRRYLPRRRKA